MSATAPTPLLDIRGVSVRYGAALALSDISLTIDPGSVIAILGPNGAGKSTIARAVSGLVPVAEGSITLNGSVITSRRPDVIRRAGVVLLPEGRGVFTDLSVEENLRLATFTLPRSQRGAAIATGYDLFPVLGERRRQVAGTLSGGEQQMLSLARALVVSPSLVIADELSLGLAPRVVDVVFESLGRAREAGVAVLLIEQFVHRALGFADTCALISRGKVVWTGPSGDARDEVLRRYMGAAAV